MPELLHRSVFFAVICMISGCASMPDGISPVTGFDINRYLGTWYEIARLDHRFERDLIHVTAEYRLREDNGIRVINRGFNPEKQRWQSAEGQAYFIGDADVGRLKVSFFGPFYSAYNIIALDKEGYNYVLVCGPDRSYLWILARSPDLDQAIVDKLIGKANNLGFQTDRLIFVDQRTPVPRMQFQSDQSR